MSQAGRPIVAVFDPEPVIRDLYRAIFAGEGYAVAEADALTPSIVRAGASAVVSDISAPTQAETIAWLRSHRDDPTTARIPVVFCTSDMEILRACGPELDALGAVVLPKPFDLGALLAAVGVSPCEQAAG